MSIDYPPATQRVLIGAGTAIKIGFFGAFGALLFWIVLSIVFGIIALILLAAGLSLPNLPL